MSNKNLKKDTPKVHKDLDGFNIKINSFGEIESSMNTEKLNQFLDETMEEKVEDPKDGWKEEEE